MRLHTLLLLFGGGSSVAAGSGSGTAGRGTAGRGRAPGPNIQEQVLDVLALEGLGEQRRPDGFNIGNACSLDERLYLVGLYFVGLSSAGVRVCKDEEGRRRKGRPTVISIPSSARMRVA